MSMYIDENHLPQARQMLPARALTPVVTPGFAAHGPIPTNRAPVRHLHTCVPGTEPAQSLGDTFRPFLPATLCLQRSAWLCKKPGATFWVCLVSVASAKS